MQKLGNFNLPSFYFSSSIYSSTNFPKIEVCKKININLLETSPEIRMNEHSFTWALTKTSDNNSLIENQKMAIDEIIDSFKEENNISDNTANYEFHKKNENDTVWWIDNRGVKGEMLFTFDKKKIYNLFRDYTYALTQEEKEIFDKENPYWVDFFRDR